MIPPARHTVHARLRLLNIALDPASDPVAEADKRTSLDDARIALCIACGVPLDDIDPSGGYNLTRRSYNRVRQSWRDLVTMHGPLTDYDRPGYDAAVAYWTERRPEYTRGDDWLADLPKGDPDDPRWAR